MPKGFTLVVWGLPRMGLVGGVIRRRLCATPARKTVIVPPKLCDFRRAVWNNENMANLEKKGYVDPGWPKQTPGGGHYVTEVLAKFAGANSPYGDVEFPVPAEELGYVHPYTRINK